jgi:uncharacterized caspase-like protein
MLASALLVPIVSAQTVPRRFALLIGLNRHLSPLEGIAPLPYAEGDVAELSAVLAGQGYETVTLKGAAVRRETVITELDRLTRSLRPEDSLIVFIAGTAVRSGVGATPRTYWLLYPATLTQPDVEGIRLSNLIDDIGNIPARQRLVLLDFHFPGDVVIPVHDAEQPSTATATLARGASPTQLLERVSERPGTALLVASWASPGMTQALGHSVFAAALLEGLTTQAADANGDAAVSLTELLTYVPRKVEEINAQSSIREATVTATVSAGLGDWRLVDVRASLDRRLREMVETLSAAGLDHEAAMDARVSVENWLIARRTGSAPASVDGKIVEKLRTIVTRDPAQLRTEALKFTGFVEGLKSAAPSGALVSAGTALGRQPGGEPLPEPAPSAAAARRELYGGSFALLIGVSDYDHESWRDLPGVKDDLDAVKDVLERKHHFTVEVLRDRPIRSRIDEALGSFRRQHGLDPENRLLIYFAGHGATHKPAWGGDMGYFVPADAPLPTQNLNGFLAVAIDMLTIQALATSFQSKHVLFVFDSCFAGSIFEVMRDADVPPDVTYAASLPVRQFITAGTAQEKVPDKSLFRQYFVQALTTAEADGSKDGYVTGTELAAFLKTKVIRYSNEAQHPQSGNLRNPLLDKGDLIFTVPPPPSPKP